MENNLRVAKNEVRVCGVVKEFKNARVLEKEGKKSIMGTLVVKVGEFSDVEVKCFVGELTKKGEVKKAYETLEKIMNEELRTLANADEEHPATKVDIFGKGDFTPHMEENCYVGQDGKLRTTSQIVLGFGNIIVKEKLNEEDFCATFDVEAYVRMIKEEVKNGEETGRIVLECLIPAYGNIVVPMDIVAGKVESEDGDFDLADALRDGVEAGETIRIWGDIVNIVRIEKIKKQSKFGVARTVENKEFVKEFVAVGGDEVDESKQYDPEDIKEGLANRDLKLENVVEKAESKEEAPKSKSVGFGKKRITF